MTDMEEPPYQVLDVDFSYIERRLIEAKIQGPHAMMADHLNLERLNAPKGTPERLLRRAALFASLYGASAKTVARELGIYPTKRQRRLCQRYGHRLTTRFCPRCGDEVHLVKNSGVLTGRSTSQAQDREVLRRIAQEIMIEHKPALDYLKDR